MGESEWEGRWGMAGTGALTAPKEGVDARVGNEMGETMGWLLRRTKRVEELLAQPPIMDLADRLACHLDRLAEVRDVPLKEIEVGILPTQTKRYITIQLATEPCESCGGVGTFRDGRACQKCEGSGRQ